MSGEDEEGVHGFPEMKIEDLRFTQCIGHKHTDLCEKKYPYFLGPSKESTCLQQGVRYAVFAAPIGFFWANYISTRTAMVWKPYVKITRMGLLKGYLGKMAWLSGLTGIFGYSMCYTKQVRGREDDSNAVIGASITGGLAGLLIGKSLASLLGGAICGGIILKTFEALKYFPVGPDGKKDIRFPEEQATAARYELWKQQQQSRKSQLSEDIQEEQEES
eukprot:TRINITY_DN916_c0_g1_i1.p1 TRINITY_DN916_c0_g1~~TRINITY_DN916_c0_g1_i1.p1  ORF type:complete len:218 (-),score=47.73 TRINITY_DN916_c0_g1_i1:63-716(-)